MVELLTQENLTPRHISILAAVLFYTPVTLKSNTIKLNLCIVCYVNQHQKFMKFTGDFNLVLPGIANINIEKSMKYSASYHRWHLMVSLLLMWHFHSFTLLSWIKCVHSVFVWSSPFGMTDGRAGAWLLRPFRSWRGLQGMRLKRNTVLPSTLVAVIKLYLCVTFQGCFFNPV